MVLRYVAVIGVVGFLGGSVLAQGADDGQGPESGAAAAASVAAEGEAAAEDGEAAGVTELEETVVRGERVTPYKEERTTTATKTSTPIMEVPASIQIVPRQVIEDQAALGLEDVYENVSGVVRGGNTLNAQSEVLPIIRGFESPLLLRNGLRATTVGAVDLINIQSVEVLKGPGSILYGALEPGGIINYVTKKPLDTPFYEFEQQIGSYDHYRTTFDATGPLTEDGSVLYRLNGAYTNSDSFRDFIELERTAIAPSLTWRISEDTEILFDFSYSHEEVPYDTGVPFGLDGEPLVPIETYFGEPGLNGRNIEDYFASYQLTHQFNEVWTLRNQFQFHRSHARNESLRPRGVRGTVGNEVLRRRYQNEDRVDDEFQLVTDLLGEFQTGEINHDLLVGVDLILQDSDFRRFRENLSSIPITADPDYGYTPPANQPQQVILAETQWAAVYVQDQLSMLQDDRLKVLVGGRFDYIEQESSRDGVASPNTHDGAFTGRAGVLYELTDWLSPYTSVSQSFRPQSPGTVDVGGVSLDPEEGLQYEAGGKFSFFDGRLRSTLAVYQIEKENVAVFDSDLFDNTGEIAYFPGVRQRSRGIEVDVAGAITPELSVIANYAYTDTEVLENAGDPSEVGGRLGGVPLHSARVWLAYNFAPRTAMEGLGFGGGLRYVSDFSSQFDPSLGLDSYITFDAGVWYRKPLRSGQVIKLQLNVENIFDTEYYTRASAGDIVHPGEPMTVVGSVGIEF